MSSGSGSDGDGHGGDGDADGTLLLQRRGNKSSEENMHEQVCSLYLLKSIVVFVSILYFFVVVFDSFHSLFQKAKIIASASLTHNFFFAALTREYVL